MVAFWSPRAEQTVRRLLAGPVVSDDPWVREQAQRLSALPVGLDLWLWHFLSTAGEVFIVDGEFDVGKTERLTDRLAVLRALAWGATRYPELKDLLPPREPGAVDCSLCQSPEWATWPRIICPRCGGVGWLPVISG